VVAVSRSSASRVKMTRPSASACVMLRGQASRDVDDVAPGVECGGGERLALDQFGDRARVAVDAGLGQDRGGAGVILRDAQARAAEAVQVRGDEVDVGLAADAAHFGEDRGARGAGRR
jgi:hypothetical protein